MSSTDRYTTHSIQRPDESPKSVPPPVPLKDNVPGRSDADTAAMRSERLPQGQDVIEEASRKKAAEQSALAAASAVARGYRGQGPPGNADPPESQQEASKRSQHELQRTLRRQRANSGGVSGGWNPLSSLWPRAAPPNVSTKATPNNVNANSSSNNNSSGISSGLIMSVMQKYSHWETAERYLHWKHRAYDAEDGVLQLEKEISHYQDANESLLHQVQDQDSAVRKAQESAFAVVASTGPKAEDDDVVRSKLKSVTSLWKPFAKKWALKSLAELQGDRLEIAKPIFAELVAPDEAESPDGLFELCNDSKGPGILLNAELARFVVNRLLENPFTAAFQFSTTEDANASKTETVQTLHALYLYLQRHDLGTAHNWRSQTVSSIDPPEYHLRPSSRVRRDDAKRRKENYYRELITEFEGSRARALYRECSQDEVLKRRTQLSEIFRECGDLFSALWAQKVEIGSFGGGQLLKKPFEVYSREIEAHASHKLEEGDRELDGKPIQLVVEPAIVAWGNEYGEGYDQYKVWTKAVVWVSSPGSGKSERPVE